MNCGLVIFFFALSGPTPPAGRRVLPPDTDFSLQQVSEILGRKSSGGRKKGSAPAPPRRTVSAIKEQEDVDTELKSKMKLQKAKIESNTIPEYPFESNNFANTKDLSEFIHAPRLPMQPPNQKSFQSTAKDGAKSSEFRGMEDSGISRGTGSCDSLKQLAIDKSKYLINTELATRSTDSQSSRVSQGQDQQAGSRKFSYPMIKQEFRSASESAASRNVDVGTSMVDESIQVSTSFRGKQYPKVPLPLPQSASLRHKRRVERPKLNTSHSMEDKDDIVTVGKLDINNVTQTINRYGTIPKGVRIGEYLASMEDDEHAQRHHDLPTVEDHDSGTDTASVSSCPVLQPNGIQHNTLAGNTSASNTLIVQPLVRQDGDTASGIQQESNVRPSAVVKSQSSHVIVDNPKAQYSSLQRQKSDLVVSKAAPAGERAESPLFSGDPQQRPKPSPRFSRLFLDQTENVLKLEETETHNRPDGQGSSPKVSQRGYKDSFSPSSNDSTLVSSPDSVMDVRNKPSDYKAPMRPSYLQKPRLSDSSQREATFGGGTSTSVSGNGDTNTSASVLSKVARFQPNMGSEFSSFRPFQRGEGGRESLKEERMGKIPPDIPSKPLGKDEKPIISGLKPMPGMAGSPVTSKPVDNLNNGEDMGNGNQSVPETPVTKETIFSASNRLKSCIDSLATAGNKSSVNFMVLSEEVQSFYEVCSRFIDNLPPHAKFHTKELLSRLQSHQQSLKTFTSSSSSGGSKLLADLLTLNKEIIDVIQR